MSTNEEKTDWLARILSGWGLKSGWAKFLAGAIIGGLAAIGVFSMSGCTASLDVAEGGAVHYDASLIFQPQTVKAGK